MMDSADDCKGLVRRYIAAINAGDLDALDEIIADDFVDHSGFPGQSPGRRGEGAGHDLSDGVPGRALGDRGPDRRTGKVMTRWVARGTHTGNLFGVGPTGRHVSVEGIGIDWVRDGTLAEGWLSFDQFSLLQQVGALPHPDDD